MKAGTVSGCRPRGRVELDSGDGEAHGDDDDHGASDSFIVTRWSLVPRKAISLASQEKVQASIVPRGRQGKQDVPAHKGYQK